MATLPKKSFTPALTSLPCRQNHNGNLGWDEYKSVMEASGFDEAATKAAFNLICLTRIRMGKLWRAKIRGFYSGQNASIFLAVNPFLSQLIQHLASADLQFWTDLE